MLHRAASWLWWNHSCNTFSSALLQTLMTVQVPHVRMVVSALMQWTATLVTALQQASLALCARPVSIHILSTYNVDNMTNSDNAYVDCYCKILNIVNIKCCMELHHDLDNTIHATLSHLLITDIDDCASAPCENGGVCIDAVNSYTCDCSTTGYSGPVCQTSEYPYSFWL